MSPLRPHPKSLCQYWERDFERFSSLLPILAEACPELVEGGLGDEGNTGICKRDMLPFFSAVRPLNPPILGDFNSNFPPKLGGLKGAMQKFIGSTGDGCTE